MAEEDVKYNYKDGLRIATYIDGVKVTQPDPKIMSAPGVTADAATRDVNPSKIEIINPHLRGELSLSTHASTDSQTFSQPRIVRPAARAPSVTNVFEPTSPSAPALPNSATEIQNYVSPANKNETSYNDFMSYALENVEYEKRRLQEGDTLVFIDYPGDVPYYEACHSGPVSFPQRVHSKNLLATGSEVFKALLQGDKHHRTCRRRKLVGRLPDGIDWVIDLTPPDEGDEAVNLTADLSCSLGVRSWASAQNRCNVAGSLVRGKDELTRVGFQAPALKKSPFGSFNYENNSSLNSNASTSEVLQQITTVIGGGFENPTAATTEDETDLQAGIRASQGEALASAVKSAAFTANRDENSSLSATSMDSNQQMSLIADKIPEYSPIRHRAGIERLLQVIEGRDPGLDSAVKMWTLFTLAKYFDCAQTVVDYIIIWLLADPNSLFIEILPEATAKIGMGLKNDSIYRSALSILISEEALALKSRELGKFEADKNSVNHFGRVREDLDDDLRQVIEYASKSFADRIGKKFADFLDVKTSWLMQSNFGKIIMFEHDLKIKCPNSDLYKRVHNIIEELTKQLQNYVRYNIVYVLSIGLDEDEIDVAEAHRAKERYKPNEPWRHSQDIYNDFENSERIMTTFFWKKLKSHKLDHHIDAAYHDNRYRFNKEKNDHNLYPIKLEDTLHLKLLLNNAILEAISAGKFNDGKIPEECFLTLSPSTPSTPSTPPVKTADPVDPPIHNNTAADDWWYNSSVTTAEKNFDRKFKDQMFQPDVNDRAKAKPASSNHRLDEQRWTSLTTIAPSIQSSESAEVLQRASYVGTGEQPKSSEKRRKLVVVNTDPILDNSQHEYSTTSNHLVRQRIDRVLGQSSLHRKVSHQDSWPLKHKQAGGSSPPDTGIIIDREDSPTLPSNLMAGNKRDFSDGDAFIDKNVNTDTIPSKASSNAFDKFIQTTTSRLTDKNNVNNDNSTPEGSNQWGAFVKSFGLIWKDKEKGKAVVREDSAISSYAPVHEWDAGFHSSMDGLLVESSSASKANGDSEASRQPGNLEAGTDPMDVFVEETDEIADKTSRTWNKPSRARSEVGNAKLHHIRSSHEKALKKSCVAQKAADLLRISRLAASGTAVESDGVLGNNVGADFFKPQVPSDVWMPTSSPFFSFTDFERDIEDLIRDLCNEMLDTSNLCFDIGVTETLLCLNDDENRYLPLWAGGDDDGTGGVFDPDVPIADAGPVGPGPGYHTGQTNPSRPSSEWGTMSSATMSGHTSAMADNGRSDYLADGKVCSEASSQDEWAFAEARRKLVTNGPGVNPSESEIGTIPAQSVLSFDGLSDLGIQSSAASEYRTECEVIMVDDEHEDNNDNAEDDDDSEGTIGADDFDEWGSEED